MNKKSLIYKIVNRLLDEEALDINNFMNGIEQGNAVADIIEKELDGYLIVKGEVLE